MVPARFLRGSSMMRGCLAGALLGARILGTVNVTRLRQLFTIVVVVTAIEMLYKGATGGI